MMTVSIGDTTLIVVVQDPDGEEPVITARRVTDQDQRQLACARNIEMLP